MKLVCLGLGYSARAFAEAVSRRGATVAGTSTTEAGAQAITRAGWRGVVFDGERPSPELSAELATATHLVISIPPSATGDAALRHHAGDFARASRLGWIGYLSTIGVYGDTGGDWVDETTPPEPALPRTAWRIAAEKEWLDLGRSCGKRTIVFRLSGIYGPGRSAIDALKAGTARRLVKPGYVSNRIHVADIATTLLNSLDRTPGFDLYNVTDDEPSPPQDVVAYAAGLLGVPVPPEIPFAEADLTPMAASFYATCKRVRNDRIKTDLGVRLTYPTYREGIGAIAGLSDD